MESCLSGKDLCERSVYEEVNSEFLHGIVGKSVNDCERLSAEVILHDLHEFVIAELFYSRKSFCEYLAVASVRSENEVVCVKAVSHSDCGSFLSDRKVSRSRMIVFDTVVSACCLDAVDHALEFADDLHVMVNTEKISL